MFRILLTAPRWKLASSAGLLVFVGYGAGFKLVKEVSWSYALVIAATGAVAAYVASTLALGGIRREVKRVGADHLSPAHQVEAYQAVQRGHTHPDPEIRAAAMRIAEHRLKQGPQSRKLFLAAGVLLAALTVINAVAGDVGSVVITSIGLIGAGVALWQLRTAQRRAAGLVHGSTGPAVAGRCVDEDG
ncbi:hypothetical protein BWI15_04000 [Kribbella sp. ALI-6-A]|uniref:hypothetical protein n=1 Tax=Kribbella sp. ALI-6-A TaxID=1933817 RepID=UPI00097BAC93|nr:hypothetical protein [Kribbella sp. ALI-6-A]ONI76481.1 hypothetical protein BWI15_04000 [Kribbella sp. ALI-6-A]